MQLSLTSMLLAMLFAPDDQMDKGMHGIAKMRMNVSDWLAASNSAALQSGVFRPETKHDIENCAQGTGWDSIICCWTSMHNTNHEIIGVKTLQMKLWKRKQQEKYPETGQGCIQPVPGATKHSICC